VVSIGVKVQELAVRSRPRRQLNIDVHPGITGTVTLNAIEQTLPQLLSRISKQVEHLRWELTARNLIVHARDSRICHTYRIDYLSGAHLTTWRLLANRTAAGLPRRRGAPQRDGGVNSSSHDGPNNFRQQVWATWKRTSKQSCTRRNKILRLEAPRPSPSGSCGARALA